MTKNKPIIPTYQIAFLVLFLIVLIAFTWKIVFGGSYDEEAQDKTIELLQSLEKKAIVQDIKHEEIKWPKYTIRVGLGGSRKPIPTIIGLTTQERAKEWLETAWLGYTLPTWKRLGEKYEIDYTLPICIAWADSHLGKALKSKNNIGNVGNNDRGDVVHYDTLEKGIGAIFRTLNNKYLSGNAVLWELSWEGRKLLNLVDCKSTKSDEKCYATSIGVWNTNVSNCLSVIHNDTIDERYNYRGQFMQWWM